MAKSTMSKSVKPAGKVVADSLLSAAAGFQSPRQATWFDRLQQSDPPLASEVAQLADEWLAGLRANFALHQLAVFISEFRDGAVGVGSRVIERWIKDRAKSKAGK